MTFAPFGSENPVWPARWGHWIEERMSAEGRRSYRLYDRRGREVVDAISVEAAKSIAEGRICK